MGKSIAHLPIILEGTQSCHRIWWKTHFPLSCIAWHPYQEVNWSNPKTVFDDACILDGSFHVASPHLSVPVEKQQAWVAKISVCEKHEAVHYMLNEWDALMNIFTRGDYHLDNNLVERLNRYISLSRRNSLFFGSHTGAKRAAMFYSLACSCRLQGINFFEYISDVINKAAALPPRTPLSKYRELLPDKWKQKNIAQE